MRAIIDTSVYIDHWERGLHEDMLAEVRRAFVIRHSAVVLSELRRGARTRGAERNVHHLYDLAQSVLEPTPRDWWEAGQIIRTAWAMLLIGIGANVETSRMTPS
jgi:predicted nucleic acid-binding protein